MNQLHDIDTRLDELLSEIRADYLAWERFYWPSVLPVAPNEDAERVRATLEWSTPSQAVIDNINKPRLSTAESREQITHELKSFMRSGHNVLLLRVDAGVGKSTALINLSQAVATQGHPVLYLMPRLAYYQDVLNNPACTPSLWQQWHSVTGRDENGDDLCRYKNAAETWTTRGYPLMDLCKRLCPDYIARCPYRQQKNRPEPIKAGVHPHIVTGISVENIKLCVIDELPIGQFLPERIIPTKNIQVAQEQSHTDVRLMLDILTTMCKGVRYGDRLDGKRLMDAIGSLLGNIYSKINLSLASKKSVQEIPNVEEPSDVEKASEWYLFDMLRLLIPEYHAWKAGLDAWLSRVYLASDGIHLLQRRLPWKGLPEKLIILDATGRQDIYEKLLNRPVKVVDISTSRVGKVFQITGRLNNVTSVLDKKTGQLRKSGHEAADLIRLIRDSKPLPEGGFGQYTSIGVVTFKGIVDHLTTKLQDIPEVSGVWYQGSRGTNVLEGVDCLVCLGSPAIPDNQVIDTYAQLNYEPNRPKESAIRPFTRVELPNGKSKALRHAGIVEYSYLNQEGLSPKRYVSGFWDYPELQSVADLYTSDELVQAIGRGRIPFLDCHVWLLTSAHTPLVIDGIYNEPSERLNVPFGIDWKHWTIIKQVLSSSQVVTSQMLADATGVSRGWARHWLEMIANFDSRFVVSEKGEGRGRKEKVLERTL